MAIYIIYIHVLLPASVSSLSHISIIISGKILFIRWINILMLNVLVLPVLLMSASSHGGFNHSDLLASCSCISFCSSIYLTTNKHIVLIRWGGPPLAFFFSQHLCATLPFWCFINIFNRQKHSNISNSIVTSNG